MNGHFFRDLARGLASSDCSVLLVTLNAPTPPSWLAERPHARIRYFSLGVSRRMRYGVAVARLARLLRDRRVDVLQTHLFDGSLVGLAAGRVARVPLLIVTRHHLDAHWLGRRPLHVRADQLVAAAADCVIVPARAVADHLVVNEHVEPERVEVIPYGLDLDAFRPRPEAGRRVRAEFGLDGAFVVGCVARLDPLKGIDDLLTAASLLRSSIPELRVLIVGDHPDPSKRQAVASAARRLGLDRTVVLTGFRSDVAACMQAMDVLAHPSLTEALPQVVIEAMAVGTPPVVASVGGTPEIVDDGRTGRLVPVSDPLALADAIAALYVQPDVRDRYARAGMAVVRERFDAALMVEHHLDCYATWLQDNRIRS